MTTRRRFLKTVAGLAASLAVPAAWAAGPPHAREHALPAGQPSRRRTSWTTAEARVYFVPAEDYHELPPECYTRNLVRPLEIILHWDGNNKGRDLWLAPITYETMKYLKHSSHFAVDHKRAWQMLPMYQTLVQQSHGAMGFNWLAVNVEMAGIEFDRPGNFPPESEIDLTLGLVSQLMDFYGIGFEHVAGHFERDPRGLKKDPGVNFMAHFRERLRDL